MTGKPAANFRPPYFAVNEVILSLAAEYGYHSIGCVNGGIKGLTLNVEAEKSLEL
ncbi:hypothetical protein [Paenibacillus macerans]|uniref:hypothetical protein n=1 Tax=Paenibacillus macerans TaxID=44252 RepID=UPI003D322B73